MDMVQQKNGPDCAAAVRAMLYATISYETESKVGHLPVTAVIADPSLSVVNQPYPHVSSSSQGLMECTVAKHMATPCRCNDEQSSKLAQLPTLS